MSKVLAIGMGPLLQGGVRHFGAHCLRTWHFVQPLIGSGHETVLYTLPLFGENPEQQEKPGLAEKDFEGFSYRTFLNHDDQHNLKELNGFCETFRPDCIVGINSGPCALAAKIGHPVPLWCDLNGSVIIEGQVKSVVYGSNALLDRYWTMEEAALRRADRFSTVTQRQLHLLYGELAAVGRLNRHTFAHPFASHVPNAYNPFFADSASVELGALELRGGLVPQDAFVLLWSGGYNSWTDYEILLDGLEQAMRECPELHYVATGGALHGHDDLTYPRFRQAVEKSEFADRIHLLGWIDAKELPALYAHADLGLCVDARNIETMFGARNRTINMMAAGLPVLTTLGAEISDELVNAGCVLGCETDSAEALSDAIVDAARRRETLGDLGAKGRDYVLQHFSYARTTEAVVQWAADPTFAPDNRFKLDRASGDEDPFLLTTNPIERKRRKLDAPDLPPIYPAGTVKRIVRRVVGEDGYAKLRYMRQQWTGRCLSQLCQSVNRFGKLPPTILEDLTIVLGDAEPRTMTPDDYTRFAPSLPQLQTLRIVGGDPSRREDGRNLVGLLARATQAKRVTVECDATAPDRTDAFCASLLEEGLAGTLQAWVDLDDVTAPHSVGDGGKDWGRINYTLHLMERLRGNSGGLFEFGVVTCVCEDNADDLDRLDDYLRDHFTCRHVFRFDLGGDPSAASKEWIRLARFSLRRFRRQTGLTHGAEDLAPLVATGIFGRWIPRVSAGRYVGVIHDNGEVGLCQCQIPFGRLNTHEMDFKRAWASNEADTMRQLLRRERRRRCSVCAAKDLERSLTGLWNLAWRL